jgi:hypothetical protein
LDYQAEKNRGFPLINFTQTRSAARLKIKKPGTVTKVNCHREQGTVKNHRLRGVFFINFQFTPTPLISSQSISEIIFPG